SVTPTYGRPSMMKLREKLAYALAASLLLVPVLYAIDWNIRDWRLWRYHITLGPAEVFIFLAFVPGVIAVVYHLVTVKERRDQNREDVSSYYQRLAIRSTKRAHQQTKRLPDPAVWPVSANASSLLLTSAFRSDA